MQDAAPTVLFIVLQNQHLGRLPLQQQHVAAMTFQTCHRPVIDVVNCSYPCDGKLRLDYSPLQSMREADTCACFHSTERKKEVLRIYFQC